MGSSAWLKDCSDDADPTERVFRSPDCLCDVQCNEVIWGSKHSLSSLAKCRALL
jgi:hypothetical protein